MYPLIRSCYLFLQQIQNNETKQATIADITKLDFFLFGVAEK